MTYLSEVLVSFQKEHVIASVAPLDGETTRPLFGGEDEDGGVEGVDRDQALVGLIGA